MEKVVLCSRVDPASMSIREQLLELSDIIEENEEEGIKLIKLKDFSIVEIENRLIYTDGIDKKISEIFGLEVAEIIFASRHTSKDKRKLLSCHVSGNVATADYGGKPYSLAKPAPFTMKKYSLTLAEKIKEYKLEDYTFSLEVTHHGPSDIDVPSAFYEIGSTEREWKDKKAARAVAESIFEAITNKREDWIVAVGIGGTHYAPRQTELELNTSIAFAHNFAKYTFEGLNKDFLKYAIKRSEAEVVIIDEKSTVSKIKKMVTEACEEAGVNLYKSKQAKRKFAPVG